MNGDKTQGSWNQIKGNVKAHWGRLTDDQRDRLVGNIQETYGVSKDEVEK